MNIKWIGILCLIVGCGGFGFSAAASGRREVRMLQEFHRAVRYMECELQYKLYTLPELCRQVGRVSSGAVREVFCNLARELDWQRAPDAGSCMTEAVGKSGTLPKPIRMLFFQLGTSLGQFDLAGQLKELEHVRKSCESELQDRTDHQDVRLRNYRTFGLCAGVALAILFI